MKNYVFILDTDSAKICKIPNNPVCVLIGTHCPMKIRVASTHPRPNPHCIRPVVQFLHLWPRRKALQPRRAATPKAAVGHRPPHHPRQRAAHRQCCARAGPVGRGHGPVRACEGLWKARSKRLPIRMRGAFTAALKPARGRVGSGRCRGARCAER